MELGIIKQIREIRGEENPDIVTLSGNRYQIAVREEEAMAAYLFSTPIRRANSGMLVDCRWHTRGEYKEAYGSTSDSVIRVTQNQILLDKPKRCFTLAFDPCFATFLREGREGQLVSPRMRIRATTNGVMVCVKLLAGQAFTARLISETHSEEVRKNSQYLSFMDRRFKPEMTISSLFFQTEDNVIRPVKLISEQIGADIYHLEWKPETAEGGTLFFEYNLYEDKLIQDTTVSDFLAFENNAFGSVAFVGHTPEYGEQRLYSKLMLNYMSEHLFRVIQSVRLFIPTLGVCPEIEAYRMEERFCSFGSTWENKIPYGKDRLPVIQKENYLMIDLSDYVGRRGWIRYTYGMLLKTTPETIGYGVFAAGDSYAFPTILEVRFLR